MGRWSTEEVDLPEEDFEEDFPSDSPRRRPGGRPLGALLWLLALAFLAYAVLRIGGIETTAFLVAAMAATPYVAAVGVVLGLVTLLLRRKLLALVVLVMSLAVGVLMAPRILSEKQPDAGGRHIRIMAANVYLGQADAETLVGLVRQQQIDVLVLPELTPAMVARLDSAGLASVLPHRTLDDRVGGDGSGIVSRFPVRRIVLVETSTLSQPTAVIDLPGRKDIEVVAVHVQPALEAEDIDTWRNELADLPRPSDKRTRVLAGDFNASLDHAAFRALVDRGYADAGEETGKGMLSTWSSWPMGPPLTIDHIVADASCAISGYAVFDLPGSDHNAIMAELILP